MPSTCSVAGSSSYSSQSPPSNKCCSTTKTCRRIAWCTSASAGFATTRHTTSADVDEGKASTPVVVNGSLQRGHCRARLAAGAPGADIPRAEAPLDEIGDYPAIDGLHGGGVRRQQVAHRRARNRTQRNDERINPDVDRSPTALHGQLDVLTHAEDHVGRDLPPTDHIDGPLPGPEVPADSGTGLRRRDPGEHLRVEGLDVHADRVGTHRVHLVKDGQVVWRFELDLDRKSAGLLDRLRAATYVERALVVTMRGASCESHVDGTVQVASGDGNLSEVLRPLHRNRPTSLQ